MTTVQDIERAIRELPEEDLRQFRKWFAEFDATVWDAEFAEDASSGALESLADEALRDRDEGRTRPL
jgi:hypothetical protein